MNKSTYSIFSGGQLLPGHSKKSALSCLIRHFKPEIIKKILSSSSDSPFLRGIDKEQAEKLLILLGDCGLLCHMVKDDESAFVKKTEIIQNPECNTNEHIEFDYRLLFLFSSYIYYVTVLILIENYTAWEIHIKYIGSLFIIITSLPFSRWLIQRIQQLQSNATSDANRFTAFNDIDGKKASTFICLLLLLLGTYLLPIKMGDNSDVPILGKIESVSRDYYNKTLKDATLAYVSAKVVNKVVAVVQRAEISITPFGIGITIAPGEMLAAASDAIERVSSALFSVMGIALFGKVASDIFLFLCMKLLMPLSICLYAIYLLNTKRLLFFKTYSSYLLKVSLVLFFFFPASSLISIYINDLYVDAKVNTEMQIIQGNEDNMKNLESGIGNDLEELESNKSMWDRVKDTINPTKIIEKIKAKANSILNYAEDISERLFIIFINFILTTVAIPLFTFILAIKLIRDT